jgi:hypothetical protein
VSSEFDTLKAAIEELKNGLMSFDQRVDGEYTLEERLKCTAFIVFSHAELQSYFEKIARRIMRDAKSRWEATFVPDRVIATLLAYRRKDIAPLPENPKIPNGAADLSTIVARCFVLQEKAISDNNGIKAYSMSQLLCPLGVLSQDIEEPLLIQLDATGVRRGDFVHKANKISLPRLRDPFADELSDINDLIDELQTFDSKLESLGLL